MFLCKRTSIPAMFALVAWVILRALAAILGIASFAESAMLHAIIICIVGCIIAAQGFHQYKKGETYRQTSMVHLTIGLLLLATYIPQLISYAS